MKTNKEVKISYWAAHLTTVVSVTLVLLILGGIALVWTGADIETKRLKEKIEVSVVLADTVSEGRAAVIYKEVSALPFALDPVLISREEALRQWTADTGEDLQKLFGVNPLSPEISLRVRAAYTAPDSLRAINRRLVSLPGVETVALPDMEMVQAMNRNIGRLSWVLGGIALLLTVISFVLINNTVDLSVYSRRFTIHTMQLVGATDGFIRRPYVLSNFMSGVIAGLGSSGLLALGLAVSGQSGIDLAALIGWRAFAVIAVGLVVFGALLCSAAAAIATTRYLRSDYDGLFR